MTVCSHLQDDLRCYQGVKPPLKLELNCTGFRVDHLYAFFVQWSPNIYGGEDEIDPTERGFVVINDSEEEDEGEENMDVIEDHFKQERRLMRQMTKDWEVST